MEEPKELEQQLLVLETSKAEDAEQKEQESVDRMCLPIFQITMAIVIIGFYYGIVYPDFVVTYLWCLAILCAIYILVFLCMLLWMVKKIYWMK